MNNEEQKDEATLFLENSEAVADQVKRFLKEIRSKGLKYVEAFEQPILDGTLKTKGLTQVQLKQCLFEAIGKYNLSQADKSAKKNRKMSKR